MLKFENLYYIIYNNIYLWLGNIKEKESFNEIPPDEVLAKKMQANIDDIKNVIEHNTYYKD